MLIGEEESGSALTTNTDNILCPVVTQTKPEEHTDDDFVEVPPRVSEDPWVCILQRLNFMG